MTTAEKREMLFLYHRLPVLNHSPLKFAVGAGGSLIGTYSISIDLLGLRDCPRSEIEPPRIGAHQSVSYSTMQTNHGFRLREPDRRSIVDDGLIRRAEILFCGSGRSRCDGAVHI